VNLNGATLQAKANTTQFIANLTRANIYSGGVTIDSNAKTITIPQALLTASGSNGITSIPITAGGSGYIGAPVVTITGGGGIGATAAATVSGGVVTGITITSAGTGYTSAPTIALTGGGATTPATLGTALFAANASDGGLTKIGLGTLTLSGANTYTGTTTVNNGVLATTTLAANGTASGLGQGTTVTLDGGTLKYTGTTSVTSGNFNRTINVGPNGAIMDNASGAGRFIFVDGSFNGSGPLNFVDSSLNKDQFLITSGNPSLSGNVFVGNGSLNSGMLQYRSANANPFGTGTIQVNGGILTADNGTTTPTTLDNNLILNGGTVGTQQPNMTYTGPVSLQASTTVGHPYVGSVGTVTFSGGISGGSTAALNVSTASSVILSSANSYSGATTVNAGTLNAGVSGSLSGTSGITVNSGGTLALSGIGVDRINNLADVTLAAGATPGTGGIFNTGGLNEGPVDGLLGSQPAEMGVLTLSANSTIDFSSPATTQGSNLLFSNLSYVAGDAVRILNWTGLSLADNGSAGNDRLLFGINPGFSNETLASIQFFDDAGGLFATGATLIPFNGYTELVPIPEPSSWMLAGVAVLGLFGCKRRRLIQAES
jgi:autotransporter-associated beta strand protein